MALKDTLLFEFDHEMGATRRLLERVPETGFAWKPHEKSFSLGDLSAHLANLPHWVELTVYRTELDLAAPGEDRPSAPASIGELLDRFDRNVQKARADLNDQTDASLMAPWTLKSDGHEIFTMPRLAVLRSFVMNHLIHHRGQLTVYLRLQNVPIPSIYGPTADES